MLKKRMNDKKITEQRRVTLCPWFSSIKSRAKFDINVLDVAKTVPTSFCPALFAHGTADTFILPHHSEILHDAYAGQGRLAYNHNHNSHTHTELFESMLLSNLRFEKEIRISEWMMKTYGELKVAAAAAAANKRGQ